MKTKMCFGLCKVSTPGASESIYKESGTSRGGTLARSTLRTATQSLNHLHPQLLPGDSGTQLRQATM